MKVTINKIPQSVNVINEFKKRILSILDSQSQDFASKHNILRMYSGKDAAFIDTVIVPFDMIFKNAENNEYLGTRKTQCHVTTETDLA